MSATNENGTKDFYNQEKSFSLKGFRAKHWQGKTGNPYFVNLFHIDGDLQITTGKFHPFINLDRYGSNEEWRKTKKTLKRKKKYYPQSRFRINKTISSEQRREIQDAQGRLRCNDCVNGLCDNCKNQKNLALHQRQESVDHSEIYDPMRGRISSDPNIRYDGHFC
ncbi:MAG TPA: hypothetical protein PKL98_02780 [Candidatus Pacearchaeota archaeon]|nr:hypothetical protein [Candidatus Pacearchaeota archaeon]